MYIFIYIDKCIYTLYIYIYMYKFIYIYIYKAHSVISFIFTHPVKCVLTPPNVVLLEPSLGAINLAIELSYKQTSL